MATAIKAYDAKMDSKKRITLRFYLDDPIASETFDSLMRRRLETGAVMNTLIVQLLHRELCQENALSLDELETLPPAMLRRVTDLCLAGDQVIDPERFEIIVFPYEYEEGTYYIKGYSTLGRELVSFGKIQ